ncbi:target of rapamycin complex 2 subunit MAPKAP1 isoform X1 [Lethenteron reissneri]|uniref:target of rapamycin complex 2 subunit MAPKAP1 isoform X1 n=2 Tax=Lethenteron reissneri TaxID=7753 RepID=UPI002AB7300F|nr:target of rapamycin complex 2 subunit MAPKAP1 isoform X1 [Lethenteron reissneri]
MAFLDNPAILLAHIRQAHITSDDTGMCEMVLIDHDVEGGCISSGQYGPGGLSRSCPPFGPDSRRLSPASPASPGSPASVCSFASLISSGGRSECEAPVLEHSQSVDITSGWDFGIRPRSNTAQRLERLRKERQNQVKCKNIPWKDRGTRQSSEEQALLFDKKDFRTKRAEAAATGAATSLLSMRLEKCPHQLNNPFNEFSKFDGKGHVGTTATKRIDVYLPGANPEHAHAMHVVVMANARVGDLIGLTCWQYTNEGREPKLKNSMETYCLHIAEDDGEVDADFPPLDATEPIHKFGFSTLALVEKYTALEQANKQSLFVKINVPHSGFSLIQVDNLNVSMREILQKSMKKRKGSSAWTGPQYRLEKQSAPNVAVDLDSSLESQNSMEFCLVRENSSRGNESLEDELPLELATVQVSLNSHQYKSYRVSCVHRLRIHTDVQLGISGDKVEIDPVTPQKTTTKFLFKQKPVSIDADLLCACDMVEEKAPAHAMFKLVYLNNHDYKHQFFQADASTINEIVLKINYILESRCSATRTAYRSAKQRKLARRSSFTFKDRRSTGERSSGSGGAKPS